MGLSNFLSKGSLKWEETPTRDCFLGRRQSPRSPGAPSQLREHSQQRSNTKQFSNQRHTPHTNLTPPHFPIFLYLPLSDYTVSLFFKASKDSHHQDLSSGFKSPKFQIQHVDINICHCFFFSFSSFFFTVEV